MLDSHADTSNMQESDRRARGEKNMAEAVIEYRDEDTGTVFRWHGGAYIDVGTDVLGAEMGSGDRFPSHFDAWDVINVWDYEQDASSLELQASALQAEGRTRRPFRTILEMFEATCEDYLNGMQTDDDDE
jgi:hypothetical protein